MYTVTSSRKVVEKRARHNHESNCWWLWVHCSSKKKRKNDTYPGYQRLFSRTAGFSVLNEGWHIFGRRPKPRAAITIKNWQKPETALEKSLAPRVNDIRTYLHMFASAKDSNKSGFDSYSRYKQCIDHIPYYLSGFSVHIFSKKTFVTRRPFCLKILKKLCFCTASLAIRTRLAMQKQSFFNLLGQNGGRMTKVYSCICTGGKPHTFDFSASISSL